MQDSNSLFTGARSALPPGPGVVTHRTRLGVVLLSSFIAVAGVASLWARHCPHARRTCSMTRTVSAHQPTSLSEAQRAALQAERTRIAQILSDYEDAMERGEGCQMGFMKYRLEILRIDAQLTQCGYERAHLQRQIAHLEAMRARMLTGYGETQGPAGHDE
jgi:hypothetical protein